MSHIILKTQTPEQIESSKIVSRPSGDNPWHLVLVHEVPDGLESDVVDDTAAFLSQFDLNPEEEEMI